LGNIDLKLFATNSDEGAMKTDQKNKNIGKKPYEKPRLRIIELAAEEVLSAGCKLAGGGFAFGVTPCMGNRCAGFGS
jgi:hypothetical protein